ncbi:DUF1450 domain-containing protein [Romboutsia sp. MSSM.1001216sp_RTP31141st1_G3_RTP31141_220114]|uniref:DUF1450 domain-containing protein n=1 Tax=unclassified Romboutsia TaxID=2626894 RepID=UPI0031B59042
MIRVCPYCSNVDVNKLKEIAGGENVSTGCIGVCRMYSKEAVAKINGNLVIKQTEKELFDIIKK